jgi:hypothetical protein
VTLVERIALAIDAHTAENPTTTAKDTLAALRTVSNRLAQYVEHLHKTRTLH